jgi:hypothetical protein
MQTDHDENPILSEHVGITEDSAREELKTVNELIGVMIDTCIALVSLNTSIPCKELQLSIMDAQSMLEHLNKFRVDGPSAPFIDVPLEDSEVEEEDFFKKNMSAVEAAMEEEKFWAEPEEGGQSEGDKMMSSEAE